MGCAPSIAAGSSSRVSNAEDGEAAGVMTSVPASRQVTTQNAGIKGGKDDVDLVDGTTKPRENGAVNSGKGSSLNDMFLGLTNVEQRQTPMSVLLLFPRADTQCESLERAAQAGQYEVDVTRSTDAAFQLYLSKRHAVILVDTRPSAVSAGFDPETFSRLIRSTKNSELTTLIAVRPMTVKPKEESSILPLLKAGFNRQFVENTATAICLAELQSIELNDCRFQLQLKSAQTILAAVDNSNDAIEITDERHHIQYVNASFESLVGYHGDELVGINSLDLTVPDSNTRSDVINAHLRAGSLFEGSYHMRRKNGEHILQKCRIFPVFGPSGEARHYVAIRNQSICDRRPSAELSNGVVCASRPSIKHRRESVTRHTSVNIEAPITKAINLIIDIRDESPATVASSLDNVLEILRSSELYAPHLTPKEREDIAVGGLIMSPDDDNNRRPGDGDHSHHTRRISVLGNRRGSSNSDVPFLNSRTTSQLTIVSEDVRRLLESEAEWDFNIIELELLTKKSPLVHLAMKTLQRFEVLEFLRVDESKMYNWLQLIESNYHADNPYHNSTHAADVMHATAFFLGCEKLKNIFNEMDEVASLLAAIVHDLDHPGKTNSYLVNSNDPLALLYNDLAVLESHHVSLAYKLSTKDDKINIFKDLNREEYRQLRQQIVDMVLATEMTKHFEHLSRFISVINQPPPAEDEILNSPTSHGSDSERRMSLSTRLSMPDNKILIKRMLIKCADVSNPARPLKLCKEWADRIAQEYCQQTDDEKAKGLPVVMAVFDSKGCNVPKSQMSFIDFFINGMFDAWQKFCCLPQIVDNINANYAYWKQQEPIAAQKIAEAKESTS